MSYLIVVEKLAKFFRGYFSARTVHIPSAPKSIR